VKYFVSITYEAQGVLEKNIRPKECVEADPTLPVDGRFYGARQNQQCEEKLSEETTTALKSGRTLSHHGDHVPAASNTVVENLEQLEKEFCLQDALSA
jgi:hypothetical protein